MKLSAIEVDPSTQQPTSSIIWLHGLGASGHDFEDIPFQLGLSATRFVFPHAPSIPVTLNGGFVMPAWYDIQSLSERGQDLDGVTASAEAIEELIDHELDLGINPEKIVLAGFSQGGAVALHTALRYTRSLGGVMALSSYLLFPDDISTEISAANRQIPVFLAHGTLDPMVPLFLGQRSRAVLEDQGLSVEWHEYPMQHQVCAEEMQAIASWLHRVLVAGPAEISVQPGEP